MKYDTPKQHLRKLRFKRFKTCLKYIGLSFMGAVAIGILYTCLTSGDDTKKMNICLKQHDLNYCNRNVR